MMDGWVRVRWDGRRRVDKHAGGPPLGQTQTRCPPTARPDKQEARARSAKEGIHQPPSDLRPSKPEGLFVTRQPNPLLSAHRVES